jgi:hypothetical protein
MMAGSTPALAKAAMRASGFRPSSSAFLAHHHHGGGAVVDAGGVAGGDGALLVEGRAQLAELLGGGAGARELVLGEDDRDRPCAGDLDRDDLVVEAPAFCGLGASAGSRRRRRPAARG